ncbi:hypothetical protein A3G67_00475 [Candidatus Roizmanbacteria bacterium RIFCSPLOWO2_12_FULL_40_12]|nr:MAG: hypothetical protein A2779_01955 [Candidatus Roizmanbacteria bacterium RIFCSPHIGHO2_01_FULL_40_98]OGK28757.1 MAG: hypothetical protein A3C31_03875 [Candidatus Roizmanbacteria bacterium RIFCSPHIGHO2_02_FULL_40_53]OGK29615.1 MAG: hypothetical protein A2W49_00270 [Candidatus Roizmanbacteria bacterium RIFCSPHIGHO2_12_41_18]OGK58450.1 MAG: hypothetical protein A3H84_04070 [Candidatus Roizmanbacteria bacterium RIFCSPLOWO2_02_FULL_40_13]OGK60342.1 MAG: hypothetical protein A3G67_00475 [Candida
MVERGKPGLEKQPALKSELEAIERVIIDEFFPKFPVIPTKLGFHHQEEEKRRVPLVDGRKLTISQIGQDNGLREISEYADANPLLKIHLTEYGELCDIFPDYTLFRHGSDIDIMSGVGFGFHFGDERSPMERATAKLELKMKAVRTPEELTDEEKAQLEQFAYDDVFIWQAFQEAVEEFERRKGSSQFFFSRKDSQELLLVIKGAISGEFLAEPNQ